MLCIVLSSWVIPGRVSLACSSNVGTRCGGRGMRRLIIVKCCPSSCMTRLDGLAAVIIVSDATGHRVLSLNAVSGTMTTGGRAPGYEAFPMSAMMEPVAGCAPWCQPRGGG